MALTAERVRDLFTYSVVSGKLIWRVDKARAKAGDEAGTSNGGADTKRLRVKIDGCSYLVSRVVWLYVEGKWPEFEVDHIDTDPSNNAWINLRDVTRRVNQQNQRRARSDSRLGLAGVSRTKDGKFRARITVDGVQKLIGSFDCADVAHEAYVAEKRRQHTGCTI